MILQLGTTTRCSARIQKGEELRVDRCGKPSTTRNLLVLVLVLILILLEKDLRLL